MDAVLFSRKHVHISKGCGDVGGGGGDGEELEPLTHLVWAGEHLVAREVVLCLRWAGCLQQGLERRHEGATYHTQGERWSTPASCV